MSARAAAEARAEAARRQAAALERIADELGRPRRELELERQDRELDAYRRPLHKLGWSSFLAAVPGLADQFRPVPPAYVTAGAHGAREVRCPCGEKPATTVGHSVKCACERTYLATGAGVYVASSPGASRRNDTLVD